MKDGGLKMKLIIQIPCYNEEATLQIALDDLPKKNRRYRHNRIFNYQ